MTLLYAIIGLFALGAIIGVYLLALVLQKKETPKLVAFIHGGMVATALILLIYYTLRHPPGMPESVVLFTVAAVGGATLMARDLTGKSLPKWLAVGHGLIAVAGFVFLLIRAFG